MHLADVIESEGDLGAVEDPDLPGHVGVDGGNGLRRRLGLERTDAGQVVGDLPLQIGGIDAVMVANPTWTCPPMRSVIAGPSPR